jgi:hypothetical protein
VRIVADTVPLTKGNGLGGAFVEDPRAGGDRPISGARRFFIEVQGLRRIGPWRPAANVVVVDASVVVEYPALADRGALDLALVSDFEAITAELADGTKWGRGDSSTIRCVGASSESGPDDALFECVVVDVVTDGQVAGKRLRITFPVEFST